MIVGLLFPASAYALEHAFLGPLGAVGKPSFTKAEGLAFDQPNGGRLLVIDAGAGTVSRWSPEGTAADFSALGTNVIDGSETPEGSLSFGGPGEVQVAVDNSGGPNDGNIYVPQFAGPDVVDIFAEDGTFLGQLTASSEGEFGEPCGVAVDPDGSLYVGDFSGKIHKYEPAANPPVNGDNVANFAFSGNCTMAAGASATDGFIFPAHFGGSLAKLESSAPGAQKYVVDPGPTTTVTVDPATGTVFSAIGSEVKEFDASSETEATSLTPIPGEAKVMGIAVDEASGNVYVAREGNPNIEVYGPAVNLPKATTEEASVINGVVTLHGVVDAAEGPPATCEFQYVEFAKFKATGFKEATAVECSPAGPFPGSAGPTAVSAVITNLPEAAFRFRLVAENEEGSKEGETLLFDTFEQIPGLPDGRAYEMVSPSQKAGEVIPPEPENQLGGTCTFCLPGLSDQIMPMQSTADGDSVLYMGQPFAGGIASGPNEYIAPRTSSGWGIEFLSSPTTTGVYEGFSADLSRAVLSQANPALSPQAPSWEGSAFPNLYRRESGALQPLITEEPPNRSPADFRLRFGGANAGTALVAPFEHVVFAADDALTEETGVAPEAPEVPASEDCTIQGVNCNLFEWVEGELRLVNVLPNETAAPNAVIGSGRMLAQLLIPDVSHAISDDGSRIFWSSEQTGHVYVRIDGERTLEIPGPGLCEKAIAEEERVCFLTASPDGSTVLLSDGQVYELNGAETAYEATIDLTEGQEEFRGILGAAEDLSRVYFVDSVILPEAAGQKNANGEEAETGELNLYAWDQGELSFIGILLPGDNDFGVDFRNGAWKPSPSNRTAQVTPDGRFLAFMSLASLTGYDNTRLGGGNCRSSQTLFCREVFVYNSDSEDLSCASCNPSGQQPIGDSNLSLLKPLRNAPPFRQPGNLSAEGNGRLFFESQDTLSPRDINGNIQDVYEWEPEGVGDCERAGGCVYLISSGNSPVDSMFVDSSDDGDDAFFITRQQLLPRDKNEQLDLYDARVGGGFEEPASGPCSPEACPGPLASPPAQPIPGSAGFTGPGNPPKPKPKHCKKGFVKKHSKCVRKKPKKHQKGGSK
jgi:sugar lactone lactonase YvrE